MLTGHIITPRLIVVNESAWQALGRQGSQALEGRDRDARRRLAGQRDPGAGGEPRRHLQEAGMTVIEPDLESFRKPVLATVPAQVREQVGQGHSGSASRRI